MRRIKIAVVVLLIAAFVVGWVALMELEFDRAGWTERGGPIGLLQAAVVTTALILAMALPVIGVSLAISAPITWLSRVRTRRRIDKLSRG